MLRGTFQKRAFSVLNLAFDMAMKPVLQTCALENFGCEFQVALRVVVESVAGIGCVSVASVFQT